MNVGSISGAWIVGGRKGVGVGAGEQAETRKRVKTRTSNSRLTAKRKRSEGGRNLIIKKGDPLGRPNRAFILLLRLPKHRRRSLQHPDPTEERFRRLGLFLG